MKLFMSSGDPQPILVDDEDVDFLLSRGKWYIIHGYPCLDGDRTQPMHYILLPKIEGKMIDHKDRNPLNNQKENLRYATRTQNGYNQKTHSNNTSGYRGVHYRVRGLCKKYVAYIRHEGKLHFIGSFNTAEEAAKAYDESALEIDPNFAKLNFPKL